MSAFSFDPASLQALTFDVFGTVVDWHGGVVREGRRVARGRRLKVDWSAFANAWRAKYGPSMDRVRRGELPWTKIDDLHRMALEETLQEFGIGSFTEEEKAQLNLAWHRLDPWPDAVKGLRRLKKRYIVATLSNGNVRLLVDMARRAGLPWDCIFSSETFRRYKRDPEVYLGAIDMLSLKPHQVMMVAAHQDDLRAAHGVGMRTAFVPRPLEYGDPKKKDLTPKPVFDLVVDSLEELAERLGA